MANDSNSSMDTTVGESLERDSLTNSDTFFGSDEPDSVFSAVQIAQADTATAAPAAAPGAPQQVGIPAGATVVRVAVTPGEILVLGEPFTGDATLIGRVGDGNLAIKVGDVTVILQGYVDANQQAPVTVETANGQPIDVATMLASTDPAIDIQTAAGPNAVGPQGADNNGGIFAAFGPGAGLGGLNAVGALDATELKYGLIDNSIRQELAETTLLGTTGTFSFLVGPLSGGFDESFFRDPAQTTALGDFATFMTEYQDAVENPGNPLFPGWADFQGTNATGGDFQEYLSQTQRTVHVAATFTGTTGDLVLDGIAAGLTSNGSPLHVEITDQGHTLFVRRDSDNALVAVVHVEGPSGGEFTIDTFMINRVDHPDAGRDDMVIGVEFTVYDGPSPYQQEGEGTSSPSLDGSFEVTFADDVPLFEDVTYHNLDGAGGGGGDQLAPTTDSTTTGLIDEDWLKGGAQDKGADGKSNAGDNGDTAGGASLTGQVDINFGADGPSQSDNPNYEASGKHAFVLDTSAYTEGEDFPYGGGMLTSDHQTLVVLSVGPDHLTVGIPAPEVDETDAVSGAGTPVFILTLNQDTGAFTFTLYAPLDQDNDLIFSENTTPLDFGVTALDDDGDTVPATIHIEVNDDVPIARADSDTVAAGTYGPESGNVMTGTGTDSPATGADTQGADTAAVTGVAAGDLSADQDGNVGTEIQGSYGKLTLDADGGYSYTRDPGTKGGVDDVFTYTLTDKDGDTSTATLTIHIGDAGVTIDTPSGRDGTIVYEQGLPERSGEPAGSGEAADGDGTDNDDPSEATSGIVTITAPDGIATLQIGGHAALTAAELADLGTTPVTYTDATGELTLTGFDSGTGKLSYTYTLLDNTLVDPDSVSFALKVTDIDGSEGDGTLTIAIIDDKPTANPDTDAAGSGALITGNVESNDVSGADGPTGSGVVGVAKGTDTSNPVSGGTGLAIAGDYGTLTLNDDGTYSYQAKVNADLPAGALVDHFVYTIADGDGDVSTTTLDITVTKLAPATDTDSETVDESALDTAKDGDDLAASAVTGSNPASTDETKTGQLTLDAGVTVVGGNDQTGSFGTLHVDADGKFTYTLTTNLLSGPADDGTNTVADAETFTVTIQDADGNTATDTIKINVIDDVPNAAADADAADSGATVTGNVETNDGFGADGKSGNGVVGVAKGTDTSSPVSGNTGIAIAGDYGTLTLNDDGSYSYQAKVNTDLPAGALVDHFVYTIEDADGDLSTTTLDITVTKVTPASDTEAVTVDEAALDTDKDGDDLAAGTVTGLYPTATDETKTGQLVLGVGVTVIAGNDQTSSLGVLHVDADGKFTYTLTSNLLSGPANDGTNTVPDADVFTVTIRDADGNTATDTIKVSIIDDVLEACPDADAVDSGGTTTGNVETNDGLGADGKLGNGVVGVATGSDTSSPVSGGTGIALVGDYGTLTLNDDGTYSYQAKVNTDLPAGTLVDHFVYTIEDGDGDRSTSTLDITVTKVTPASDTESVTVNEAALDTKKDGDDLAASAITGSNPSSTDETKTGQLTLGSGVTVTGGNDQTGSFGTLHVDADGKFVYTLTSNVLSGPADDGTNTVPDAETFTVTIQDANGNSATDTIKVSITDDVPDANADTDAADSGTKVSGNVESNDGFGADGKLGSGVVGVAKGTDTSSPVSGGTGIALAGDYGTLTLNADGTYSYQAKVNTLLPSGSLIDHFVYTISDKDGDLSTTTLDITVNKVTPTSDTESVTVNEAALDKTKDGNDLAAGTVTGSNPSSTDETKTGTLSLGAGVTVTGGNDQTGSFGTLHVDANGKFTYTLTSNMLSGPANDGTNTVADAETFTVTIRDANGNTATDTIKVSITDDVPTANADTNAANSGTKVSGNVETNDGFGADGKSGSGVVGVAKGTDTSSPVSGSTGVGINGDYGTLTLNADGTYSYQAKVSALLPAGTLIDHFVYTISDKDGDLSTTTLDITVTKVTPTNDTESVTVNEAALDKSKDGSDLLAGTVTGSNPGSTDETKTGALILGSGVQVTGGNDQTGSFGTLHVDADGKFTYTLTSNMLSGPANDGTNTAANAETFSVTITDANGNTGTDTIKVSITDDVPTANADTGSLNSGTKVSGNVETNDVFGADGKSGNGVVGVAKGTDTSTPVSGGTGVAIVTALGTLTLNDDGTYSYQANANVSGIDHFVYTIKDKDGDLSTTTLDITVSKVAPATNTQTVTVNEAALDLAKDGKDLAAGTVTGSNPGSTDETKSGQLVLAAGVTATAGDYAGKFGILHVDSDGKFTYTLTTNMNSGAVSGANTVNDAEIFNIQIQDAGGNTATDQIKINVIDDIPSNFDPQDQSMLNSASGGVITGTLNIAGHTGADGYGSIVFSGASDGSKAMLADGVTPITYQTHDVLLSGFGTATLTGYADLDNDGKIDLGETPVFTIKLDGAGDKYEFTLLKELDDGEHIDFTDLSSIKAGNTAWLGVGANTGAADSKDLLYTPFDMTKQNVNTSSNDIGSGDQWIDKGEGIRMDFVQGLTGTFKDENGFDFAHHYQVQDFQVAVSQVGGGGTTAVRLTIADSTKDGNVAATTEADFLAQTLIAITAGELQILRGGSDITGTLTIDYTDGGKNDGGVIINGLQGGDIIKIHEDTGFDRLEIDSTGGTQFSLSGSKVLQTVSGVDLDTKFQTTLSDGDGDTSSGQYIGINLQTDDGQSHTFTGGVGNDTMHGGSGNDTVSGGAASDYIFGDAGNDSMLYDSADKFDGGAGFDRLVVQTAGTTVTYDGAKYLGIEMVDLGDSSDRSGAGNQNTLALNATDVVGGNNGTVAGHQISFFVIGDNTGPTAADHDNVVLTGFGGVIGSGSFTDPVSGASHNYDVYASIANPAVKIAVEQGLDVT